MDASRSGVRVPSGDDEAGLPLRAPHPQVALGDVALRVAGQEQLAVGQAKDRLVRAQELVVGHRSPRSPSASVIAGVLLDRLMRNRRRTSPWFR